ncbi:4Fe-4S dicluster domain-containing protein [Candidatus Bathyarchaeota archaeon]|nr:4Fe-4S dicluster domain-containing protein [Candidatus Bathyarchaeota archaeon]
MSEKKLTNESKAARSIKMGDFDPKFKYEISKVPGVEKLKLCFQCGTCTADCPVARFSEVYNPRKLLRMTLLGMKDRVLSSEAIWLCAACFTCVDHCPQGVDIAAVMRALRNMAAKDGIIPPVFEEITRNIRTTGCAYRIPELRLKKRAEKGLPPLPKTNVEAVAKLLDILDVSNMKTEKS